MRERRERWGGVRKEKERGRRDSGKEEGSEFNLIYVGLYIKYLE
jgi:hypothetical protein